MDIRALTADHRSQTEAFVGRIPPGEQAFLDRTLLSQVSVAGWTRATPARRMGAFEGNEMIGLVTVAPGTGWMSHVADFRCVVQPSARGKGVAKALVDAGVALARSMGLGKLTVEVMSQRTGPIAMFESFGFEREAVLRGHVRDGDDVPQDLALLSRFL